MGYAYVLDFMLYNYLKKKKKEYKFYKPFILLKLKIFC